MITSPHENAIVTCRKVLSSQPFKGGKHSPRYALYGISPDGSFFSGEASTFLGWYADYETLSQEVNEIQNAIAQGIPTYRLQYSARVRRKWLRIVLEP